MTEKKQLALYINHGKHFQLREVFGQKNNFGYKSNQFGIVVKAAGKAFGFPSISTKEGLIKQGFVIVE